jgi:hypothetical protein
MRLILFVGNTQMITLPGVVDGVSGVPITGATITATLYDSDDQIVSGFDHLAMADVEGTAGDYVVTLPSTFSPAVGKGFYVIYEGTKGALTLRRRQTVEVQECEL